jgi:hypothetical protein
VSVAEITPFRRDGFGRVDGVSVDVLFRPGLPVNVALEVYIGVQNTWYYVGPVAAPQGNRIPLRERVQTKLTPPIRGAVDVRLESSVRAAERTIDMYEIWDGTLRFDKVHATYPRVDSSVDTLTYP